MYLDLNCPIELVGYELSRDDSGKVRAYLSLNNLRKRPVVRIEGAVHWIDGETGRRASAPFIADRLPKGPQRPFRIQLASGDCPGAAAVELTFDRLRFAGGGAWTAGADRLVRIEPPPPPRGAELNRLRRAAGPDARHFPVAARTHWLCVCGRPNGAGAAACARCGRGRARTLDRFAREKVLSGETPARHAPGPAPEVPRFLGGGPDRREAAQRALDGLRAQCRAQRGVLIRRSAFVAAAAALAVALALSMRWLGERSEVAKGMLPAVRVQQEAAPRGGARDRGTGEESD